MIITYIQDNLHRAIRVSLLEEIIKRPVGIILKIKILTKIDRILENN